MYELSFIVIIASRGSCGSSTYHWYIEQPFTYPWGILKGTSRTWLYIGRPLVYGYGLDSTTINLSSHVPWVYRETPLGYLIYLRKSLWTSCVEQYTKNNILGDYYARNLVVYRALHLLDNPGERPTIWAHPVILIYLLAYSLSRRKFFGVFFLSFETLG